MTTTIEYPKRTWDKDLREWTCSPMRDQNFYDSFAKVHGVSYGGTWDGYLQFEKKIVKPERPVPDKPGTFYVRQVLYGVTACTDEDIDNGTAAWMIEGGFTRIGPHPTDED